jgi:site-specific DNA-methyltransferase (adenine-specific)
MNIEFNKVIQGDSDLILKDIDEAGIKVDLVLTDPPYNLNKDFGNDSDKLPLDEFLKVSRNRISLCKNLLTPYGSIIWFGIHKYIGFLETIMYELGLYYRRMNIWYYENGFSRVKNSPMAQYEPFLWFSNSDRKWTYNADDVRVPYKSKERLKNPVYYKNSKGERKQWVPNPKGALRGDIWAYPTLAGKLFQNERTDHPTQKPEALIMEIIKAFCPKDKDGKYNGVILDPFLGSGTLAVCCEKLNLEGNHIKWIGIELEPHWCDVANSRLEKIKNMNIN